MAETRPLVARLALDAEFRSCGSPPPGCQNSLASDSGPSRRLLALAAKLAREPATAAVLRARGLVALAAGVETGDVTEAIQRLEEAREVAPDDAAIANDLAVALFVQAELSDDLRARLEALEMIDLALKLDPELSAARYNRALLLVSLTLDDAAVEAWSRFEAFESDPSWRLEARTRAEELWEPDLRDRWRVARAALHGAMSGEAGPEPEPLAREHPQQVRTFVEDELLPAWGAAVEANDLPRAWRLQRIAVEIVDELSPDRIGPSLHSALQAIEAASEGHQRTLATAHRLYGEARAAHENHNYERAAPLYRRSAVLFDEAGSPFWHWPRFYLGVRKHYATPPDYAGAVADFEDLLRWLPRGEFVSRAYAYWMIGYSRTMEARWAEAVPPFQEALRLFEIAGELENVGTMQNLLAGTWRNMGEVDRAWEAQSRAVSLRRQMVKSRHLQNVVSEVAEQLIALGRWGTALYFADEWVREAERSGSPMSRSLALAQRAQVLQGLGRGGEALEDLRTSLAAANEIKDRGARFRTRLHVALEESKVLVIAARPGEALEVLEEAARRSAATDTRHRLTEVLVHKAAVERRLKDPEAALGTLEQALQEIFRQRSLLFEARQRRSYLDQARGVMEALVDVQLELGLAREALDTVEATRSLELKALLGRSLNPQTWRAISGTGSATTPFSLPADTAAMVYLVLPERLVVWEVRDGTVEARQVRVSKRLLESEVERFFVGLKQGTSASTGVLRAGALLARWSLPTGWSPPAHLLVVPDGPLHRLPFAALPIGDDGDSLLLQSTAVAHLPSLAIGSLLDQAYRLRIASAAAPGPVLWVGEIPHSDEAFPNLPQVGPVDELEGLLAASTLHAQTLRRADASPAAFLREYPLHSVVIFSGHSLSSSGASPAGLVLAPGDGGDGFLTADQIEAVPAGRCRLVVLASCSGARGEPSPSEGPRSLVTAFFAAGVPTVIASLAEVRDESANALLLELSLDGRRSPAEALRLAQLRLAEQGHPPAAWAFFQSHGSSMFNSRKE